MTLLNFLFLFLFVSVFSTGCSFFKASKKTTPPAGMEEEYSKEDGAQSSSETESPLNEEDVVYVDEEDEMEEGQEVVEDDWSEPGAEEDTQLGFGDSREEDFPPPSEEDGDSFPSEALAGVGSDSMDAGTAAAAAVKKWIPLKKIKSSPYQKAGVWVNAVYIAREGETLQSVSNKIFNSDRVAHLQAINSHLKNRGVKVGDKIYYNSPVRPDDGQQLLFYFVDQGTLPTEYLVEAGKNIRQVSRELLGHPDSWKEIWATNPELKSKGKLDHSVTIRYFPPGAGTAAAQAPSEEPQVLEPESVEEVAATDPPPPPPLPEGDMDLPQDEESLAMAEDISPPPSLPEGDVEEDIPPVPGEVSTPPPPSQVGEPADLSPGGNGPPSFFTRDRLIFLGIMGLALILCVIALWKRKRKKEYDFASANIEID